MMSTMGSASRTVGMGKKAYSSILVPVMLLVLITVPDSLCQYYYHNGYYYPQQQYFQLADQSWQYQQQQLQVQRFQQQQHFAPPPPPVPQLAAPPPQPQVIQQQPPVVQPSLPHPMAVQQPPPTPAPTVILPEKKVESETRLEFDLPPPPPAQFLPEEKDRVKIAQLLAQRRNKRPKQPANGQLLQQQSQAQRNLLEREQQAQRAAEVAATRPLPPTQPAIQQTIAPPTAPIQEPQSSLAQLSHLEPKSNDPNNVFLNCCKHKRVDKVCESRCNFDNLNKKVLTQMFIGTDPCPQHFGLDLFSCAAQDSDHTPCCLGKKVERTSAGKKCLAFCKMTPDSHFQADASYLPCWSVLNHVKACFKEAILKNEV